jgi:hypothetical protein
MIDFENKKITKIISDQQISEFNLTNICLNNLSILKYKYDAEEKNIALDLLVTFGERKFSNQGGKNKKPSEPIWTSDEEPEQKINKEETEELSNGFKLIKVKLNI